VGGVASWVLIIGLKQPGYWKGLGCPPHPPPFVKAAVEPLAAGAAWTRHLGLGDWDFSGPY
jgi:hypothetical protein